MMEMAKKPRSDSLAAELTRQGLLDDFFAYVSTESPSYDDMRVWLSSKGVSTSIGALHNLVSYHMGIWKAQQAVKAAEETAAEMPEGSGEILSTRIAGMKFDLVLSNLTAQQQLAVWKLSIAERELESRNQSMRDAAVEALLQEAGGNERAKAALNEFLAALDEGKGGGNG